LVGDFGMWFIIIAMESVFLKNKKNDVFVGEFGM
jgi:hypothetical protein